MNTLKKKKVLLIAARFFGYEEEIRSKLLELGAEVDYYDQRPSNSFLVKGLIRINKHFLLRTIKKYYLGLIEKTRTTRYDFVLFISPEVITKNAFLELKKTQSNARFILYMWDSFRNKGKNIEDISPFFDYRYSFDKEDCDVARWNLVYRPLFFLNAYAHVRDNEKPKYDLLFIGTIHSDRYKILSRLRDICAEQKLSHFYYMFFPSKLLFYLKRIVDPILWRSRSTDFRFDALKKNEIVDYVEKSNVVVDIQHPNQIGLTIRTIEVLGAKRKLLTTNKDIVNYDFYNPNNIQVLDRDKVNVDISFFKKEMVELDETIYKKYSIDGWISVVFSLA